MSTRMYDVQTKMYEVLNSNEQLKSMVTGVYDYVPESTVVPYVTFGHMLSSADGSKTDSGEKITVTLDVWSEGKGRRQTVMIMQVIEEILEDNIQLNNSFLISQKITNREVWEESYGLYHGTVETEFQIEWE
ncbi:DUF3168 domain-containing protein [Priestia megaterium]|uniref:DUF3168 domain-containing protein n=1 Tax=Priestia megaterium TaxID=1404 RepID=UPI0021BFDFF2|nr:DUF3168 domain-containing protein [Priestia megaterium]MCT9858224.1 DUF3168 domain-containing protein [Priestia megaterium]MDF1958490.1 DUF3168 domain-containing protein [Priestia megaterium]